MGILDFFKKQAVETSPIVPQLQEEADLAKNTIAELNTKLKLVIADLEKTKELAAEEKNKADTKALALKEATQQLDLIKKAEAENKAVLELKSKELINLKNIIDAQTVEITKLKEELESTAIQRSQDKAKQFDAEQENELLLTQLMEVQEELEVYYLDKVKLETLYQEMQVQIDAFSKESINLKNIIDAQTVEITKLKEELESTAIQRSQDKAKQFDAEQENELLLTQLMEVQEELEVYYLDKVKFEKLYQEMQVRWTRLEKRHPNYVDFGSIELVAFDNLSDTPSITWRAKDYAQGGVVIDEFVFHTILCDGQPGISLVFDAKEPSLPNNALVPKLIKLQSKEFERFVRMSRSDFGKIMAAVAILAQLEASSWRGVELPQDFDLGFWRQSLKLLPAQLQALPVLLRYDAAKLKRELINPDYEHLWLELKGMGLGSRVWPKFEIRLGAAMVQRNGFSQFPKFEIPLIDGKIKPFDSWYAESQDDNGAKLELRFSLEKQVFDTSVWSKLDDMDKAIFIRLIYVMPDILLRLEAEHIAIHRPWASWIDLAKSAMQVIEVKRMAAKSKDLPTPEPKPAAIESTAAIPAQLPPQNTKNANLEKTETKKIPTTKQGSKLASKLSATAKKNVATNAKNLDKKTSNAKQSLATKKAITPKKAESTKSFTIKVGRKK